MIYKNLITPLLKSPFLYLGAWLIWFSVLWYLSGGKLPEMPEHGFKISDKVMHWGYFGIGGALMTFFMLAKNKARSLSLGIVLALLFIGMAVGALDEWHQSWNAHRSGNDLGDFLADTFGTLCGILISQKVWALLSRPSS